MKPWMKTLLKRTAQTLAVLLTFVVGVHLIENWRGKRAWEAWKAERIAAGEVRDLNAYAPPPVPDAENFAKASMIEAAVLGKPGAPLVSAHPGAKQLIGLDPKAIGDWQKGRRLDLQALKLEDLEAWLAGTESFLAAWAEAARRPHCRLLADYGDVDGVIGMPALLGSRGTVRVFRQRALVHLHRGRAEAALQDVESVFRVVRHLEAEPHLVSQLLRLAMISLMLQPVYEGLEDRRWDEAQLARLEAALQGQELLAPLRRSWTFDRLGYSREAELGLAKAATAGAILSGADPGGFSLGRGFWVKFFPKGWIHQELIEVEKGMLRHLEEPVDPKAHRVKPGGTGGETQERHWRPFGSLWLPGLQTMAMQSQNARCARIQAGLDQARIAVALERHRLSHKAYPASLNALTPAFLPSVPHDLITGEPLRYRLKPDGTYILYAMGWDAKDDGGQRPTTAQNPTTPGDWVWR